MDMGSKLVQSVLRFLVTQMMELHTPTTMEAVGLSHTKLSGLYWALCAIYTLHGGPLTDILLQRLVPGADISVEKMLRFVKDCLVVRQLDGKTSSNPDGELEYVAGFSGSPGHDPHLIHTTSALQCLLLLNKCSEVVTPDLGLLLTSTIVNLQVEDGGFYGDNSGEKDTRFAYCAVLCLTILLKRVPPLIGTTIDQLIDVDALCAYILRCLNLDGGFGTTPGDESHGGQIFCCVATLHLLNKLHLIPKIHRTLFLLSNRQCSNGGFSGRPEKDPDSCYSWWIGAPTYILLDYVLNENNNHTAERLQEHVDRIKSNILFDLDALTCFITTCMHPTANGIADRPENYPDEYHTFFALAALGLWDTTLPGLTKLVPLHPSLALPIPVVNQLFGLERRRSSELRRSSSVGSCVYVAPTVKSIRRLKGTSTSCTPNPRELTSSFSLPAPAPNNRSSSLQLPPSDTYKESTRVKKKFKTQKLTRRHSDLQGPMNGHHAGSYDKINDGSGAIEPLENISQESISIHQVNANLPPIDMQTRKDTSFMLFEGRGGVGSVLPSLGVKLYELRRISALLTLEGKTIANIYDHLTTNQRGPIPAHLLPGQGSFNAVVGDTERQPSVMLLSSVINKVPDVIYMSQRQAQLSDDTELRMDRPDRGEEKSFSTGLPILGTEESRAMNILLTSLSKGRPAKTEHEDNDGCLDLNPAALEPGDALEDTSDYLGAEDASAQPACGSSAAATAIDGVGVGREPGFARISSVLTIKAPHLGTLDTLGTNNQTSSSSGSAGGKNDRQDKVTFASPLPTVKQCKDPQVRSAALGAANGANTVGRQLLDTNTFEKLFSNSFAADQQQSGLTDSQIINTFVDTDMSHQPSIYRYPSMMRNFFDSISMQDQSDPSSIFKPYNKGECPGDFLLNWGPSGVGPRQQKAGARANATASVLFAEPQVGFGLRRNIQQQSSFLYQTNNMPMDMLSARQQYQRTKTEGTRSTKGDWYPQESNVRSSSSSGGLLSAVTQNMVARILGNGLTKARDSADAGRSALRAMDGSRTTQRFNAAGGLNIGTLLSNASLDISRIHALVQTPSRKEKVQLDADMLHDSSVGMLQKGPEAGDNEAYGDSEVKETGTSNMSDMVATVDEEVPVSSFFNSKSQSSVERGAHTQDTACDEREDGHDNLEQNELVISGIM